MRTDLAMEAFGGRSDLAGIREEVALFGSIEISRITVETEQASRALDKPIGRYITLTVPENAVSDAAFRTHLARCAAGELHRLLCSRSDEDGLVVGLGNRYVTPDALGPRTAEHVFATRHILKRKKELLPEGTRAVSSFAPNVLGVTGMETVEVVSGLIGTVKPAFVLFIDSLASVDSRHIGRVIQLNDSGISPGAGIGNFQTALSLRTVGVPVLAMGVPLVVSGETIVANALSRTGRRTDPTRTLAALPEDVKALIVTPKDVDALVSDLAKVLSEAVNLALHGRNYRALEQLLS